MCEIYRLDFTAAGVISMKMYCCIAQCDSPIHVSTWLWKCWWTLHVPCRLPSCSSHGWPWLQKSSNAPLLPPEYITSNRGPECTGIEAAGAFFFCGHNGQCISWSNWLKLCINVYVCNMSALRLRYTKVGNFSCLIRSVYASVRNPGTSLAALRWILSMASESLFSFGSHMQLAYSRCGLIMALYNWRKIVDAKYLNVCLRHPKILLAMATWVWTCIENFSWLSIVTSRYFSSIVTSRVCTSSPLIGIVYWWLWLLLPRYSTLYFSILNVICILLDHVCMLAKSLLSFTLELRSVRTV